MIKPLRLFFATLLAPALTAFGNVTITTDWQLNQGQVKADLISLNLWSGMEPSIAANVSYKAALDATRPNFIRYHAGEQLSPGSERSWVDTNGNWIEQRIKDSVSNTHGYAQTRMVTITRWPNRMRDPANLDRLDPAKVTEYANWCGELVAIMKNNGYGVTYFEPFNEVENAYASDITTLADIFTACRNRMKQVDPAIKVGGPVYQNPWSHGTIATFLDRVGTGLDFFSYHHYATGTAGDNIANIYDATSSIASRASGLRQELNNRGLSGIPLMLTEQNMFYSWEQDQSTRHMGSAKSAVFDALLLKDAAEGADLMTMPSWNDADYTFGKFDNGQNYARRWSGHFLKLSREHLLGEIAATASSDAGTVRGFAVFNGTKHVLALINRSGVTQIVDTAFAGGWSPATGGYTEHRISTSETGGYASSTKSWNGAPGAISMPAHSVFLLQFTDSSRASGQKPFGGSARQLSSRIQAEDYDTGGQGVAYNDRSFGNEGSAYRNDRVDIRTTTDAGGGHAVSEIEGGEWLEYTVNVNPGTYAIKLRASSYWGTGAGAITVKLDGATLGSVQVPQTWNDDGFADLNLTNIAINQSGAKVLRLEFNQGGMRLNWIEFTGGGGTGAGTGTGLSANYYGNTSLSGSPILTRVDGVVNFDWGNGSPGSPVGVDNFSARWTGQIEAPVSGSYTFTVTGDDGVRLSLAGSQVINGWVTQGPTAYSYTTTLAAGQKVGAQLEYFEQGGGAVCRLQWSYPGQATTAIPQSRLYPSGGGNVGLANGIYKIVSRNGGRALDVSGVSTADGALVHLWDYFGANNQKWQLEAVEGGYKVLAVHSGKALDVAGVSTADNAQLHQWTYGGGDNQKWAFEDVGGGDYKIVAKHSGKVLGVENAGSGNGSLARQQTYTGTSAQKWQVSAP